MYINEEFIDCVNTVKSVFQIFNTDTHPKMVIVFYFLNLCNRQTLFFMGLVSRIHAFESSMLIKIISIKNRDFEFYL